MRRDPPNRAPLSLAPEHDWAAAAQLIRPALWPVGTAGADGAGPLIAPGGTGPGKPLVRGGPVGLTIVYVIPGPGFDVVVGVDHLQAWGVAADQVHAAAMANLGRWSDGAGWFDEIDESRRVVWSDHGDGLDAARILLAQARSKLAGDLAPAARILVGLPERDLLVAVGLGEDDEEFASRFADYVADLAQNADQPIDGRVFQLVDGELAEYPHSPG